MHAYSCLYILCAALIFAPAGEITAADGEYRAPVNGLTLTPPKAGQQPQAAPPAVAQPAQAQQAPAVQNPAADGLPGSAPVPAPGLPSSAGAAPSPAPAPGYAPGYAPYSTYSGAPANQQNNDVVYGTTEFENNSGEDRGSVSQYRDPQTGDIITSVVPPAPPQQQDYGTFFISPQIYPDGKNWGYNPYSGGMPRPGGQYAPPQVIWAPNGQPYAPPGRRPHHDDRFHDQYDRHDDDQYRDYGDRNDGGYDDRRSNRYDDRRNNYDNNRHDGRGGADRGYDRRHDGYDHRNDHRGGYEDRNGYGQGGRTPQGQQGGNPVPYSGQGGQNSQNGANPYNGPRNNGNWRDSSAPRYGAPSDQPYRPTHETDRDRDYRERR